jgi:spore maturation protein CgeB
LEDLKRSGCKQVRYLPFGYDEELFHPQEVISQTDSKTVLFVGGADDDRARFFEELQSYGCPLTLIGSYWERYRGLTQFSRGQLGPDQLLEVSSRAAVNLCLVRRANRDGHVMRSFEIPAMRGFMIAEETDEHIELFGREGECVLYFNSARNLAQKVDWALANPTERMRMAGACHQRIVKSAHTYLDRLRTILASVPE